MPPIELLAQIRDEQAECLEDQIVVFGQLFYERKGGAGNLIGAIVFSCRAV